MANRRESDGEEEVDDTPVAAVEGDGEDEVVPNEETVNEARKSKPTFSHSSTRSDALFC